MLQPTTAREDTFPVIVKVAACLVVDNLERFRANLIDAIDTAPQSESQAPSDLNDDRLGLRECFRFGAVDNLSERNLKTKRRAPIVPFALGPQWTAAASRGAALQGGDERCPQATANRVRSQDDGSRRGSAA